ncbi:hypothetical protein BDZ89DRAFT_623920 [Hymenopellis radicata]|nr:hypothetical protein BDZ89DRAFT_623920 [Hymenopellis radicata]
MYLTRTRRYSAPGPYKLVDQNLQRTFLNAVLNAVNKDVSLYYQTAWGTSSGFTVGFHFLVCALLCPILRFGSARGHGTEHHRFGALSHQVVGCITSSESRQYSQSSRRIGTVEYDFGPVICRQERNIPTDEELQRQPSWC